MRLRAQPLKRTPAFADLLLSDGPHASIPAAQRLFAPFVGAWDLTVRWFDVEGRCTREERGEWHFAWVLEGRAIQDVWIVPSRAERRARPDVDPYEYGTSLRFYDAGIAAWRSTWVGPVNGLVRCFIARRIGGEIVLDAAGDDTSPALRWVFSNIADDHFDWRNEIRDGTRWRVQQTFDAVRRAA